jgi:hypothetical protein
MEIDVECPSGLKGRIRAWKVKDRAIYKDQKVLRSNTLIQEIVQRVWLSTTDPGPYNFSNGQVNWGKVLQGDTFWAFIQSRRISKGDIYTFRTPCRSCANSIETPFDLSELQRKDLPQDGIDAVRSDQPIEIEVDGRTIKFRLLRTEDNRKIAGLEDNYKLEGEYAILAARLVEVSGLGPGPIARARFVQDLDEGEADRILAAMEEYDCGADVAIKVICENCGHSWGQNLPLQPSFFQTETTRPTGGGVRAEMTGEEEETPIARAG